MAFQGLTARCRAAGALVLIVACRSGGRGSQARLPPPVAAAIPARAPAVSVRNPPVDGADTPSGPPMPSIAVVLRDPRLSLARERDDAGDEAASAREVDRVRAIAALSPDEDCAFRYMSGRLHLAAGEFVDAAHAFEGATAVDTNGRAAGCPLAAYARLRQGQALVKAARYDEALAALKAIDEDFAGRDEAILATADAFAGKGDRAAALPIWRAKLAAHPHGIRWVDVALNLATALLDGAGGPASAHAREAFDAATRVVVEAPTTADRVDAGGLRDRAARAATQLPAPPLSLEERAWQAQAWLDEAQPKRARDVAADVLRAVPKASRAHADAACKAATVFAQAAPHGKYDDAADAWGVAIARCEGNDALPAALYYGAKASASARRHAEALSRFDAVEKRFPDNHLADDARLRAALIVQDDGDEPRALSMLVSLPDVYPQGDTRTEALFRVALARIDNRDWPGAKESLDRILGEAPDPVGSSLAGRADYFRARVAELAGDADDATARYEALVSTQPLSYYMRLAYGRLHALDQALARSTLEASAAREPAGALSTREHPEFALPAFRRFVRLLEVGDVDAARREASAGGLLADGVDPEVLWTVAWLYDRAGAPEIGHAFARSRLVDYRSHWPAGRWRLAWEVAFPRPFDAAVLRESEVTGIPPQLTWAIMREESAFNPEARSPASALGLMQLMSATARRVARDTLLPFDEPSLRRPDVSIALGTRLLASLRASFPDHPELAIAAYNSGSVPVRRWLDRGPHDVDLFIERIPFDETRNYVKRVLASEAAYAYLYAPAALDGMLGAAALSLAPSASLSQNAPAASLGP